eukprot:EG_transcript_11768
MPMFARAVLAAALRQNPEDVDLVHMQSELPPLDRDPDLTRDSLDEMGAEVASLQGNLPDEALVAHFSQSEAAFEMTNFRSRHVKLPRNESSPAIPVDVVPEGVAVLRCEYGWGLFATGPFAAGDTVLQEQATLAGHSVVGFCAHCTRPLPHTERDPQRCMAVPCPVCRAAHYCSAVCQQAADAAGHTLLCAMGYRESSLLASIPSSLLAHARFPVIAARLIAAALAELRATGRLPRLPGMAHLSPSPTLRLDFVPVWNGYRRLMAQLPPILRAYFDVHWYAEALGVFLNNSIMLDVPVESDVEAIEGMVGGAAWRYVPPDRPLPVAHTFSAIPDDEMVRPTAGLASGVFPAISCCNHACRPTVEFCSDGSLGSLVALEPLQPGQPLLLSYVDDSLPRAERRKFLRAQYGFRCRCDCCERRPRASAG